MLGLFSCWLLHVGEGARKHLKRFIYILHMNSENFIFLYYQPPAQKKKKSGKEKAKATEVLILVLIVIDLVSVSLRSPLQESLLGFTLELNHELAWPWKTLMFCVSLSTAAILSCTL